MFIVLVKGMLAVALSRVRTTEVLQVLDFTVGACVQPPQAVLDFLAKEWMDTDDIPERCCRKVPFDEGIDEQIAALVLVCFSWSYIHVHPSTM